MDTLIERLQNRDLWDNDDAANSAEEFSQELIALQSIYEQHNVDLIHGSQAGQPVILQVKMPFPDNNDSIKLQVELPSNYPDSDTAPKMKLVNRAISGHSIDEQIYSEINRTFTPFGSVPWARNSPVLFQGLDCAYESVQNWLRVRSETTELDTHNRVSTSSIDTPTIPPSKCDFSNLAHSDIIVERKSEFLGHAIRISSPDEVPEILKHILESDKRIQRATHPIIHAWICRTPDGVLHHAAAGGRLAHLLFLLEIENALVVVTRWFGGILLGPERFKHINRAARDALTKAGLIDPTKKV